MTSQEELRILQMVYDGVISAAEADRLLQALSGRGSEPAGCEQAPVAAWGAHRRLKQYPLIAGCGVTALGAALLAAGYARGAGWVALALGYAVLVPGLLLALVGVWLLRATWLRIRISGGQSGKPQVGLYLPVPLTLGAWAVRLARPFVPGLDMADLDRVILALRDRLRSGQIISIDVADQEDGRRVELGLG